MGNLFLARTNMVNNQVSPSQVTDVRLLEALLRIPRELFVPAELSGIAYADAHICIGAGRTLIEPTSFARLVQLTKPGEDDTVLDIGCGTGYSTAIFAALTKKVIAIEPEEKLASGANYTLNQLGIRNVIVIGGTLMDGHPEGGPYTIIFLNGAVEAIPPQLIDQLAEGGRLVAVLQKPGKLGEAVLCERHGEVITQRTMFGVNVPPLMPATEHNDNIFSF